MCTPLPNYGCSSTWDPSKTGYTIPPELFESGSTHGFLWIFPQVVPWYDEKSLFRSRRQGEAVPTAAGTGETLSVGLPCAFEGVYASRTVQSVRGQWGDGVAANLQGKTPRKTLTTCREFESIALGLFRWQYNNPRCWKANGKIQIETGMQRSHLQPTGGIWTPHGYTIIGYSAEISKNRELLVNKPVGQYTHHVERWWFSEICEGKLVEIHRVRLRNIGKNVVILLSHSANASDPVWFYPAGCGLFTLSISIFRYEK